MPASFPNILEQASQKLPWSPLSQPMLIPCILIKFGWCLSLLQQSFHRTRLIALYGDEDCAGCRLRVCLTSFRLPFFGIRGPPLPTSILNSSDSHDSRDGPVTQASDNLFTHPTFFSDQDEHVILHGPTGREPSTVAEMKGSNQRTGIWLSWNLCCHH